MWKNVLLLFIYILFVSGCAAIISGLEERISVNSIDPDATIFINGAVRGKGSISVSLPKKDRHTFTAKKEGCKDVSVNSGSSFNGVTLLDIFWGYGMLLAFPIDFGSGAAWNITPKDYTVTPICP